MVDLNINCKHMGLYGQDFLWCMVIFQRYMVQFLNNIYIPLYCTYYCDYTHHHNLYHNVCAMLKCHNFKSMKFFIALLKHLVFIWVKNLNLLLKVQQPNPSFNFSESWFHGLNPNLVSKFFLTFNRNTPKPKLDMNTCLIPWTLQRWYKSMFYMQA
jgi:hypothetical protein